MSATSSHAAVAAPPSAGDRPRPQTRVARSWLVLAASCWSRFVRADHRRQRPDLHRHRCSAALSPPCPIALAGLGGLWSERAGVVNIGLEGMMILGTIGAGYFGYQYGPVAGVSSAPSRSARSAALLHALATVIFGVDHIVSGVAINIMAVGVARVPGRRCGSPGCRAAARPSRRRSTAADAHDRAGVADCGHDLRGQALVPGLRPRLGARRRCVDAPVAADGRRAAARRRDVLRPVAHGVRPAAALLRREPERRRDPRRQRLPLQVHRRAGLRRARRPGRRVPRAGRRRALPERQTNGRGYIGLAAMIFGNWRPGGLLARRRPVRLHRRPAAAQRRRGGARAADRDRDRAALATACCQLRRAALVAGIVAVGRRRAVRVWWYFTTDEVPARLHPDDAVRRDAVRARVLGPTAADARGRRPDLPTGRGRLTCRSRPRTPWPELVEEATRVMRRAYAPYSDYPVGAAGLVDDGRVVVGLQRRERRVRRRAVRRVRHGLRAARDRRRPAGRTSCASNSDGEVADAVRPLPAAAVRERRARLLADDGLGREADERGAARRVRSRCARPRLT